MTVRHDDAVRYRNAPVEQGTAPFDAVGYAPSVRDSYISRPTIAPPIRRINNAWLFTLVAVAITTVGLLYLVQTSHVAGLGYEVSRLEGVRMEKSLENQQLTYDIARQQSLPAIEQLARNELDMAPIDEVGTRLYITIPMPADDELPVPGTEADDDLSLGGRIWSRLTGTAHASNRDEDDAGGDE